MGTSHSDRLLLAAQDYALAKDFRDRAQESLTVLMAEVELRLAVEGSVPAAVRASFEQAIAEWQQLCRVCLHLSARRLDSACRARGIESDRESAVIMFDMTHPVASV